MDHSIDTYLTLFWVFFKIGLFSFGGGYAIISLMQHEIVEHYQWLTVTEFTDIVAIAQSTPGAVSINAATYTGYAATGNVWGAAVATIALSLPSVILMLACCVCFAKLQGKKYWNDAFTGLRPVVIGIIAAAALHLTDKDNFIDLRSVIICFVTFFACFKIHPVILFLLAGAVGWLMY
jgi:chromate transporter